MLEKRHLAFIAGASLGAVLAYGTAKMALKLIHEYRFPFVPIGTISQLHIYPMKSAKGIQVNELYCGKMGPTSGELRDRHFAVVNGENKFVSGREISKLLLIECDVKDGGLHLSFGNTQQSIFVNLDDVVAAGHVRRATRNKTCVTHNQLNNLFPEACGKQGHRAPWSDYKIYRHPKINSLPEPNLSFGASIGLFENDGLSLFDSHASINQRPSFWKSSRLAKDEKLGPRHCEGYDCGDAVGAWLQSVLQTDEPLRLLYYVNGLERLPVKTHLDFLNSPLPDRDEWTTYTNRAPYMACSDASLAELQSKLPADEAKIISMRNFRPNIVVAGCPAFDEDKWMEVRIGDAQFSILRPCDRCLMTTINPATGERNPTIQPMRKMREFRLAPEGKMRAELKDSPLFGTYMCADKTGVVRLDDVVYARRKKLPFS